MKKKYISPELHAQLMQTEGLLALSLMDKKADDGDALVKGAGDWDDIWDDEEEE